MPKPSVEHPEFTKLAEFVGCRIGPAPAVIRVGSKRTFCFVYGVARAGSGRPFAMTVRPTGGRLVEFDRLLNGTYLGEPAVLRLATAEDCDLALASQLALGAP